MASKKRKGSLRARAVVTIHNAKTLTPQRRLMIAAWLSRQAAALMNNGADYANRFRARYMEIK